MNPYLKLFRSVRFNIWLFLVIAVVASVGTFFPQEKADLLYHSWPFAALLALMAFDVLVCKLHSLPRRIHGRLTAQETVRISKPEDVFTKSKHKAEMTMARDVEKASSAVRKWLQEKNLNYREEKVEKVGQGSRLFVAGRHRLQRWGDFILHISILIILAGNLLGVLFGFEEFLPIPEGSSLPMKNRPYEVRVLNFDVEYYQSTGAPSLYTSDLLVEKNGTEIARKKIVVNEPLDINRVRFYQASWGITPDFRSARLRMAGREIKINQGEVVKIAGTPFFLRANAFMPSFNIGPNGEARNENFEGKNPALQIDFLKGEQTVGRMWVLKNDPHAAFRVEGGRLLATPPPPVRLLEVEPLLFSGIQIGYDPGAPLFWTGAVILLVGLSLQFYLHQRRLRILLLPTGRILIGGWNSRAPQDFEREFTGWVSEIKARLA